MSSRVIDARVRVLNSGARTMVARCIVVVGVNARLDDWECECVGMLMVWWELVQFDVLKTLVFVLG